MDAAQTDVRPAPTVATGPSNSSARCILCDSATSPGRVYHAESDGTDYRLLRCVACDFEYWDPRTLRSDIYQEEEVLGAYKVYHRAGGRLLPDWCRPFFSSRFPTVAGRRPTLLDVGCGDGPFLAEAAKHGWDVWGIDFDRRSVEVARRRGLTNVHACSLEEFSRMASARNLTFDVITFFEVLEHQDDPVAFLSRVKELLKPGGYVAGSVPNRQRFLADLDRKVDSSDFPPHHFLWFSKKSMSHLFEKAGFGRPLLASASHLADPWTLAAWWQARLPGTLSARLESTVKRSVLTASPDSPDSVENMPLELIEKMQGSPSLMLRMLKLVRNAIFLPLSIPTAIGFLIWPAKIYFRARLEESNVHRVA
jgi:SAM-dependent methyltransferase